MAIRVVAVGQSWGGRREGVFSTSLRGHTSERLIRRRNGRDGSPERLEVEDERPERALSTADKSAPIHRKRGGQDDETEARVDL